MALQGGLIHKKDIRAFYLDLLEMICALPGTDTWYRQSIEKTVQFRKSNITEVDPDDLGPN